jgi:hypothetical protein
MRFISQYAAAIFCSVPLGHLATADEPQLLDRAMEDLRKELDGLKVSTNEILMPGDVKPSYVMIMRYSNVTAGADSCSIRYHVVITSQGKIVRDSDDDLNLRTIGFVDVVYEGRPPMQGATYAAPHFHLRAWPFNFNFPDAASAERVRSKFAAAMRLCPKPPTNTVTVTPP